MNSCESQKKFHPRETTCFLSDLFWTWTFRLFKKSYSENLNSEDLFLPLEKDRSDVLGDKLEKVWREELEKKKKSNGTPNLLFIICRCFFWEIFFHGVLHFVIEFVSLLGIPILFEKLLHYFQNPKKLNFNEALAYASGICLILLIKANVINHYMFNAFQIGAKIRVATCSLLYRKILKLHTLSTEDTTSKTIMNLLTDHVNRFEYVVYLSHYLWSAPLLLLITSTVLYIEIGFFGMFGVVVLFTIFLIQLSAELLSSKYRKYALNETNERIHRVHEIIHGIKMIKINAWEKYFCTVVSIARKLELNAIKKSEFLSTTFTIFNYFFASKAAMYFTIVGMLLCFDVQLTSGKIFALYCFFNMLSRSMNLIIVSGITVFSKFQVSVKKIQDFLMSEETVDFKFRRIVDNLNHQNLEPIPNIPYIDEDSYSSASDITNPSAMEIFDRMNSLTAKNWAVKITSMVAKWYPNDSERNLDNVNMTLERGKLYVLIGTKGSGRSSLLSSILGELPLIGGNLDIRGNLSYASQEPWIFNSTIRQNIVFGKPHDDRRYQKVIKVCALQRDFQKLPEGDQTIVGENVKLLSEEQKAKIHLARAVYHQANIYVFDDILSDVNVFIGNYIFEECIQKYLFGQTRILVTRQLQFVKNVDGIILIEDGSVKVFSSYNEFLNNCPEYLTLLADESREYNVNRICKGTNWKSIGKSINEDILEETEETVSDNDKTKKRVKTTSRSGIQKPILIKFLKFGANWVSLLIIGLLFIITQVVGNCSNIFLTAIAEKSDFAAVELNYSRNIYINDFYIYSALIFSFLILLAIQSGFFYMICMHSNQKLHDRLINSLIKTSLQFFGLNSNHRILNCVSEDVASIDKTFPKNALNLGIALLTIIGSVMIICAVNYIFFIPVIVIFGICYILKVMFTKIIRNSKEFEEVIKSQIFNRIYVTLDGLKIIRACSAENILKTEFDQLQDDHNCAGSIFFSSYTVFAFIVNTLCSIFITTVIFTFLLTDSGVTSAEIGLAIFSALSLTEILQWSILQSIEVRNQLDVVRRILELSHLPSENITEITRTKKKQLKNGQLSDKNVLQVPNNWPTCGSIRFHQFSAFYSESHFSVLNNFSAKIKAGEKIGVIEKSSVQGESSIISALFRLTNIDGVLEVDDINTDTICLDTLRRQISLIPKNPMLFSGTLRMNLDPHLEYSDFELCDILEETGLKRLFSLSDGLDIKIANGGMNLTNNQKQLICLARAILQNNKIIIYHVSERVTPHTDYLIQRTIRNKFSNCTVFIISHKLDSIIECDKVLVIDNSRVVEFDHPYILLKNKSTRFSSLVRNSGRVMSDKLIELAYEAYNNESGVWV